MQESKTIKKAYKYRIYPTKEQEIFFAKTFGCCRFIWNRMLAEKLSAYEKREPIPQITLAKYKEEFSFLKEVDSLALTNVQLQLEKAFRNHLKKTKHFGLPKFKRKRDKQSYTTNNVNGSIRIDFGKGVLYLPKIKDGIKIELHRTFEGQIKSATVSKTKDGKYYVSILVETEEARNKVIEPKSKACGIDLGLEHFATITNDFGTYKVEHPKNLRRAEKRLKKLQKDLSRKQKGSKNYEKVRQKLAKLHAYISNARNDFLHKLFKAIIDENQVVVVEDINVKGLMKSNLAKSISDSSWSKFLTYLRYKAEWYGRTFIQVDRFFPSSKLCHCCGYKKEDLALHERTWTCFVCRKAHDRDINASINLYFVGLGRPEVKPLKHALVDDRISQGIPKKLSCFQAGSSTFYKVE
jgi:putative transposase